jgi:murein L,D-transpeptidase YafK
MVADLEAKQMDKGSPILMRIFKEEAEAEIWKVNRDGEYALLKTYPICRWSGDLGPKQKEGDRQAPEGFYTITPGQMNPNSNYYLAFNTGYPNAYDRSWNRTGSELMVHGDCSSRGCYAMTDEQMVEIYALARESFFGGQKSFQLQAFPFRMTAVNMAKHRNNPNLAFWRMLKTGSDHFEATHQEPKVDVCERRYVFNAGAPANASRPPSFSPRAQCPVYEVPKEIATLVNAKEARDNKEYAELVADNVSVVASRKGIDGGMNPVFLAKLNPPDATDNGRGIPSVPVMNTPGALPRTSNRPPAQVVPPAQPSQAQEVEVASAEPAPAANVPVPRTAPQAKSGEAPGQPTGIASLIGGLFGETQTANAETATPAAAPKKIAAKPKHHAAPVRTAAAPKHENKNEKVASAVPQLRPRVSDEPANPEPAKPKRPEMRSAFSASSPSTTGVSSGSGTMAGAQPVVPAGTFESRWSALR